MVDSEIWDMVEAAEMTKEMGMPPITGGSLDQSAWFMDAARCYWADCNRIQYGARK